MKSVYLKLNLLFVGWRPGRDVWHKLRLPEGIDVFSTARKVLSEFGLLKFGPSCERTILDPAAAGDLRRPIELLSQKVGVALFPIGVTHVQDVEYLVVDENEVIYRLFHCTSSVPEVYSLRPLAANADDAVDLLMGRTRGSERRRKAMLERGLLDRRWEVEIPGSGGAGSGSFIRRLP